MSVIMDVAVSLKLWIYVASGVDFTFAEELTAPKAILILDAGDNFASRLKSSWAGA